MRVAPLRLARFMKTLSMLSVALWVMTASVANAATLSDLAQGHKYFLATLAFEGNHRLLDADLAAVMQLKPRQELKIWKPRPEFEADILVADLHRLKQLYRSRGYYEASIAYDLTINRDL